MLDWRRSYASTWRVYAVNPATWADADPISGVSSVSVTRDASGAAPLIDSGSISVTNATELPRGYYRIVMYATQDGTTDRIDVATLEFVRMKGSVNYGVSTDSITGYSVLYPASTLDLDPGQYAPAGANGAEYAASLLRLNCIAPVVVDGPGFALATNVVPSGDVTALQLAWEVLAAGGYTMQVHGDGEIHILPRPTEPAIELDAVNAALVRPGIDYTDTYDGIPNRLRVTEGSLLAVAVNDSIESPTSRLSVGYWIDASESNPVRTEGETLDAYALRALHERSVVTQERTYKRKWWPDVYPGDIARGSIASVRLDGDLRITRQALACGAGIEVTERAQMEVSTWT